MVRPFTRCAIGRAGSGGHRRCPRICSTTRSAGHCRRPIRDRSAAALGRTRSRPWCRASSTRPSGRLLDRRRRVARRRRAPTRWPTFAEAQRVPVAVTLEEPGRFRQWHRRFMPAISASAPQPHARSAGQRRSRDRRRHPARRYRDAQNYTFPRAPDPAQPLIHIYPDATPIGAVFRTTLGIIADPVGAAGGARPPCARGLLGARSLDSPRASTASSADFHALHLARTDGRRRFRRGRDGDRRSWRRRMPIIITDAGNISTWVHRHWRMTPHNLLLGVIAGAMGFGVPAGVAAASRSAVAHGLSSLSATAAS